MSQKQHNTTVRFRFDDQFDLYYLRIGGLTFESTTEKKFSMRMSELRQVNLSLLPENYQFILYDEGTDDISNLVNIKITLIKSSVFQLRIMIEESSRSSRWLDQQAFDDYFNHRCNAITARAIAQSDVSLDIKNNTGNIFFILYSLFIKGLDKGQLIKIIRTTIQSIHKTSENFEPVINSNYEGQS